MPVSTVGPVTSNFNRLNNIFKARRDPDYKAVPDERYDSKEYPNAEVVSGVKVGEKGLILPFNAAENKVTAVVDLSHIPGDTKFPIEIYPNDEFRSKRGNAKVAKAIMEYDDSAFLKFPALFQAVDLFNNQTEIDKLAS